MRSGKISWTLIAVETEKVAKVVLLAAVMSDMSSWRLMVVKDVLLAAVKSAGEGSAERAY